MLFVGDRQLSSKKEISAIRLYQRVDKYLVGEAASRGAVLKALQEVNWVHFVCHGRLDKEPFNCSLELADGGLALILLDIVLTHLPNAEFAYLSACHTAEQRPGFALDEVLHLTATMQFCGFRSVIGTMWQLLDGDRPFLTETIYECMTDGDEEETRFKRAAAGVREAVLMLRKRKMDGQDGEEVEIMTERWVNLVHFGA